MDINTTPQALSPSPTPRSPISASAQGRILIWRTEVASARDPLELTDLRSAHEASSLSNSSSSNTTASSVSPPLTLSRGRRFLRRISRRLSGRGRLPEDGPDPNEPSFRTAMYRALAQPSLADLAAAADQDADVVPGEQSSSDIGARGGLREKQERLMRAARLLDQGASKSRQ